MTEGCINQSHDEICKDNLFFLISGITVFSQDAIDTKKRIGILWAVQNPSMKWIFARIQNEVSVPIKVLLKLIYRKIIIFEVNRNIILSLLAFSIKHDKIIDMENAFKYPSCWIPVILANIVPGERHRKVRLRKLRWASIIVKWKQRKVHSSKIFVAHIRTMRSLSFLQYT